MTASSGELATNLVPFPRAHLAAEPESSDLVADINQLLAVTARLSHTASGAFLDEPRKLLVLQLLKGIAVDGFSLHAAMLDDNDTSTSATRIRIEQAIRCIRDL